MFHVVLIGTVVVQVIITQFGGRVMETTGLNGWQWFISIAIGFGGIQFSLTMRVVYRLFSCIFSRVRPSSEKDEADGAQV